MFYFNFTQTLDICAGVSFVYSSSQTLGWQHTGCLFKSVDICKQIIDSSRAASWTNLALSSQNPSTLCSSGVSIPLQSRPSTSSLRREKQASLKTVPDSLLDAAVAMWICAVLLLQPLDWSLFFLFPSPPHSHVCPPELVRCLVRVSRRLSGHSAEPKKKVLYEFYITAPSPLYCSTN